MSAATFDELLKNIHPKISKVNTRMRACISAEEKLVISLRYLATGCSLSELHYNFRVGRSTASVIIKEVCEAIWECLLEKTIPKLTTEQWLDIAKGFERNTKFPNCIGAIDGKHIRIKQPPNSGSMYYNYKNYFSTVLFAMCDSNYCFTYVDVGSYGKSSDSGIFKNSTIFQKLCDELLEIPPPRRLSNINDDTFPYVIVGDEAFPLMENLLRPFGGKHLTENKQLFNAQLSKARRYIECTFGLLANKWRIFHRPIDVDIDLTEIIIKSCCVLHNFVRMRDGTYEQLVEEEISAPESTLQNLLPDSNQRGNIRATSSRDKFCSFFAQLNNNL